MYNFAKRKSLTRENNITIIQGNFQISNKVIIVVETYENYIFYTYIFIFTRECIW